MHLMPNIKATAMKIKEWNEMKPNETKNIDEKTKKQFSLNDSRLVNWTSKNCEYQLNAHHQPHEMRTRSTSNRREKMIFNWRAHLKATDTRWEKGKRWKKLFWLVFSAKRCIHGEQNSHLSYGNRITCSNIYHSLIVYEYWIHITYIDV